MSKSNGGGGGRSGISRRDALGAAALGTGALATSAHAASGEPAFTGRIGLTLAQSTPDHTAPATAPRGSPNIVVVMLDDVGYSDFGCYGAEIDTPAIDALAARGLRYTNFRTTGVCSATRASFLTGLNPHSAGIGWLTALDSGFPGYRGDLTKAAPTLAEVLRANGYSTYQLGKWHVNAEEANTGVGPVDNWPLQRGFDRAYWFQGHSSDFFRPASLFDGNQHVVFDPPAEYYLTDDLTDRALAYLREHRAQAPGRPFFLNVAHAAAHSPLQVRQADLEAVRDQYRAGWDEVRARRLARQKALGIVPANTVLPPRNPGIENWSELPAPQRRLYERYMEAYAAMIRRVDWNIGRIVSTLSELGVLDDTLLIVTSDNGGSPDGGLRGTPNLMAGVNGGVTIEEAVAQLDEIGGPDTYPMYPAGWAMASNTPYRLYKHDTHLGGVADPMVIHWPAAIRAGGGLRRQYAHVMDLYPTVLDCAGIAPLRQWGGREARPLQGVSFKASLADAAAPESRLEQHFEMHGQRALYSRGWRLVSTGRFGQPGDRWELFDLTSECNEVTDLSAARPEVVAQMEARWLAAAARYDVLPIDSRTQRQKSFVHFFRGGGPSDWEIKPPVGMIPEHGAPPFFGRSHRIDVEVAPLRRGDKGVLLAYGNQFLGFVLYVMGGQVIYEAVSRPLGMRLAAPIAAGARRLSFRNTLSERPWQGAGALLVDGVEVASAPYAKALFGRPMQGLQVGENRFGPVSGAYEQPFAFTGQIARVRVEVDTSPYSSEEIARFEAGLTPRSETRAS